MHLLVGHHPEPFGHGEVTNYTLHGKNIVHMTQGSNELHFFYDAQNKPAVVIFNGTAYSYVKNLQGDIVAILDSTGAVVVQYTYDAWGRPISKAGTLASTLGTIQPFRYRGYVYDEETGLYYLRSRYYKPNCCRFFNADEVLASEVLGKNVYCYTYNSAVMLCDTCGAKPSTSVEICQICIDPGQPPRTTWYSDGSELSQDLAAYLQKENSWNFDTSVYVNVQASGVYVNTGTSPLVDAGIGLAGIVTFAVPYFIPCVREVKVACDIIGGAATVVGGLRSIAACFPKLQNAEYYQWTVTITATNVRHPEAFPDIAIIDQYECTLTYLWNDEQKNNPYWYLLDKSVTLSSTTLFP